ncbi:hypothetical protein BDW59DRAFT_167809 [Aspergillus cavernicola]|uniref:Zn(2)-C6 fungal-type domain-containing protein n=1 Tax=Aspergillus cavernicola TaxID=176166 RepID=A0ABR4HAJ8_9EURO
MSAEGLEGSIVTRRLALNACEPCRQRKAKCDEGQPQCGRCARLRLSCHYKDISVKKDPVLLHIKKSLASLESKMDALRGLLQRNEDPSFPSPSQSGPRIAVAVSPENTFPPAHSSLGRTPTSGQDAPFPELSTEQPSDVLPSTPLHHSTAPQNILLWPCLQASLPNLDSVYGLRGEIAEHNTRDARNMQLLPIEPLSTQDNPLSSLTMSHIKCLTKAFFDDLSIYSPVLVESEFADHILGPVLTGTSTSELDICTVLLVLFLGGKSLQDEQGQSLSDDLRRSLGPFLDPGESSTWLSSLSLRVRYSAEIRWRSAQALLLAGLYYSQEINVLDHFNAVHRACTVIMMLLQSNPRPNPNEIQIYWVAYAHESQLLAEFELPASGIGRYEDMIPFPFSEDRNTDAPGGFHRMIFLAHLALRKLLNRIHSNIYSQGRQSRNYAFNNIAPSSLTASSSLSTGFSPSLSIIDELDHQLELWRQHLPAELSFPTLAQMNPTRREDMTRRTAVPYERALGSLRTRYCSAKSIILRPFLYKLLNSPPQETIPPADQENARLCLLADLQAVRRQGVLGDSIRAIPMPVNLIRCFFAGAILLKLVHQRQDLYCLLPANWEDIHHLQARFEVDAAHLSPTIAEDMRILRRLDYMSQSNTV